MNFGDMLYRFTIDLIIKIINLTDILYDSLFWSINIAGKQFSLWALIGGVGFATLFFVQVVKLLK